MSREGLEPPGRGPGGDRSRALREHRVERLAAARLYFVCDSRPPGRDVRELLAAALRGGADLIQLRDKAAGDSALITAAGPFREAAEAHAALFILNDRPDLVAACGADGVHVGQDDLPVAEARRIAGPDALVGLSTHSEAELDSACAARGDDRPDQLSVGPIWETPTKEGRTATGLGLVEHAARAATLPWFAIGGIDTENVDAVVAAGARRIVVVRAIRDADDPEGAARLLRGAVEAGAR
jgi:thiamine-phosphate pyrophosphorylase